LILRGVTIQKFSTPVSGFSLVSDFCLTPIPSFHAIPSRHGLGKGGCLSLFSQPGRE
jgi:hypothetical protein